MLGALAATSQSTCMKLQACRLTDQTGLLVWHVLQVLPSLLAALTDPEGEVRGAAGFALGQFSEYLQPDITHHHAAILPAVFGLLQDADTDVQERACYGELNIKSQAGTCTKACTCSSANCSITPV
jgi:HEAT repeat protein